MASALGCIVADARHDFIQTLNRRLDELEVADVYRVFAEHEEEGRKMLAREGLGGDGEGPGGSRVEVLYQADMVYDGQVHEVLTPLPLEASDRAALRMAFEDAYRRLYGDNLNEGAVRIRTLRTAVIGLRPRVKMPGGAAEGGSPETALKERRRVFFEGGYVDTPVYERGRLPGGEELSGPAVIEQADATTVLEPGTRARVHGNGSIVIEGER